MGDAMEEGRLVGPRPDGKPHRFPDAAAASPAGRTARPAARWAISEVRTKPDLEYLPAHAELLASNTASITGVRGLVHGGEQWRKIHIQNRIRVVRLSSIRWCQLDLWTRGAGQCRDSS